jgi:serine/threonine protein kinase
VLDQRIGGGSMGTVWSAHHTETGEAVAVKILSDAMGHNSDLVGRFLRERSALLNVHHPHLVEFRDVVIENERIALVMELVEGVDSARLLERDGPMSLYQMARLGDEISRALMAVHAAGIVHRDLKPANILVEAATSEAKLVDFGIAWIAGNPRLTASNSVIGTPHYLAPELLAGGQVSPAADVYSLAVSLYQLLTGVLPFDGEHYAEILYKHLNVPPPPHPAFPPTIWSVVEAMLAKDPAQRPTTEFVSRQLGMFARVSVPLQPPQEPDPALAPASDQQALTAPAPGPETGPAPAPMNEDSPLYTPIPPPFGEYELPPPVSDSWHGGTPEPPSPYAGYATPPPFGYEPPQEEKRPRRRIFVIAGICVLALGAVGAGAWALTSGGGGQKPQAAASSPPPSHVAASTPPPAPPALVTHHWTMCCGQLQESGGGTTATNGGVVLNDVKHGDAVFDGKAGTQILVDGPVVNTKQSFTVAMWMHLQGKTTTPSGREVLVEQRGTQGCAACVELDPFSKKLAFEMQSSDTADAATTKVEATNAPTKTDWYRLVASYDADAHTMSFYIGGVLQGTKHFDANWAPTGPLSFGSGLQKGVTTDWYAGSLADLWIWNRAMTPQQVDQAAK